MPIAPCLLTLVLLSAAVAGPAAAQTPDGKLPPGAAQAPPANQDLEPAVDTSATAVDATRAHPQDASAAPPAKSAATSAKTAPRADASSAGKPKAGAKDRIELDTTQITGNRELPKVLYIVPWKHSDLSDLGGRPANSLLDEVLTPIDRDVFQRENRYYGALQPDAPRAAAPVPSPPVAAQAPEAPPARVEK
jgi:hypothetical protein